MIIILYSLFYSLDTQYYIVKDEKNKVNNIFVQIKMNQKICYQNKTYAILYIKNK